MSHPLEKFKFCPVCGSANWSEHNFKSKQCGDCGFVYYANPCAATAAIILNSRNEMLVARRGKEPAKGTLDLVGGFADMYELLYEYLQHYSIPVCYDFPIGHHSGYNYPLVEGCRVHVSVNQGGTQIEFLK